MFKIDKKFIPLMFCAVILFFGCAATKSGGVMTEPLKLNSSERKFLDTDFKIVKNREQIRNEVISRLSGENALIANPGDKYNETDVVDLQYPSRMIIFAGQSNDMTFVHYMQGGFAPHSALYLAKFDSDTLISECAYMIPKANDIDELKSLFQSKAERIKEFCNE